MLLFVSTAFNPPKIREKKHVESQVYFFDYVLALVYITLIQITVPPTKQLQNTIIWFQSNI